MQTQSTNPLPQAKRQAKIERETKMTMEVSGVSAGRKDLWDILLGLAFREAQNRASGGEGSAPRP